MISLAAWPKLVEFFVYAYFELQNPATKSTQLMTLPVRRSACCVTILQHLQGMRCVAAAPESVLRVPILCLAVLLFNWLLSNTAL